MDGGSGGSADSCAEDSCRELPDSCRKFSGKVRADPGKSSGSVSGKLLEKLPDDVDRASLPERMLPWTSVLMRPEWERPTAAQDATEAECLAVAIGQLVVAADCAARIATGAVTDEGDIVKQLGVCRMRRFTEFVLSERL